MTRVNWTRVAVLAAVVAVCLLIASCHHDDPCSEHHLGSAWKCLKQHEAEWQDRHDGE